MALIFIRFKEGRSKPAKILKVVLLVGMFADSQSALDSDDDILCFSNDQVGQA